MRLTVAGSGTAAPEASRACSGYWVDHEGTSLLLDCGPGVVHNLARFGLAWPGLNHLAITHFHNDHIGDISTLLFGLKWGVEQRRTDPLTVWGPVGLSDRMRRLAAALGSHVLDPGFPLDIRELESGQETRLAGDLSIRVARTPHTKESIAFRVEGGGAALGYTGDTGPSAEVAEFLSGCGLLIAECSLADEDAIPTHLSPSSLAALARTARPDRLLVTHVYPSLDARGALRLVRAAGWEGEAIRAEDGAVLNLAP